MSASPTTTVTLRLRSPTVFPPILFAPCLFHAHLFTITNQGWIDIHISPPKISRHTAGKHRSLSVSRISLAGDLAPSEVCFDAELERVICSMGTDYFSELRIESRSQVAKFRESERVPGVLTFDEIINALKNRIRD